MKRRSFLSALGALLLAPLAVFKPEPQGVSFEVSEGEWYHIVTHCNGGDIPEVRVRNSSGNLIKTHKFPADNTSGEATIVFWYKDPQ